MKSKSTFAGAAVAVIGSLLILGASFGLKAVGENRSDGVARGASGSTAWDQAQAALDEAERQERNCEMAGLPTRVRFANELPFVIRVSAVTDVDPFDWADYLDDWAPCPGPHTPAASAVRAWGLQGLELTPFVEPTLRKLQPATFSDGSPFTITVSTGTGEVIGSVALDVATILGRTGTVIFRGNNVMQGVDSRVLGAIIVDGKPRTVVVESGPENVIFKLS
jgi:hypothetical protein